MRRCLVLALFALCWNPSPASAKIFLITHGDTIKHLGDIQDPTVQEAIRKQRGSVPSVGFKYGYFGVFWVFNLWTWGGEYCLYQGDKYEPITAAQAAQLLGKSESELGKPFWYRFPSGLVTIAGLLALLIPFGMYGMARDRKIEAKLADARYQAALEALNEPARRYEQAVAEWDEATRQAQEEGKPLPPSPPPPESDTDMEAAIRVLERDGVPREEAEADLKAILEYLARQSAQQEPQAT